MPTINATNSGSGLDVRNLVDQLVAAEGAPVKARLDKKEIKVQEGLTAMGTFKGALLDFQASLAPLRKADAFKSINATSSNEDKFTVIAADNAVPGTYNIEISQLAQSQKLISRPVSSDLDSIGSGQITIEFGEVNADNHFIQNNTIPAQIIEIDEKNTTLRGIQQAINEANAGVKASIINDGSGYRLVLNAEKTGLQNSMRISISDNDQNNKDEAGLSILAYDPVAEQAASEESADSENPAEEENTSVQPSGKNMQQVAEARDAIFSVDGITISNSSNEIRDSIPGITLTLKKTTEDGFETFSVEKETAGIRTSIQSFIQSYNDLVTTINSLTGYDPETGTAGPLSGDAGIRGISDQIRRRLATSFSGINNNLVSLADIGITSSREGMLELDQAKLDRALEQHVDEIAHLFAAAVSVSDPRIRVSSERVPDVNGIFNITVQQIPSSGFYQGQVSTSAQGFRFDTPEKFSVKVDDVSSSEIRLAPGQYASGQELANALQQAINRDSTLAAKGKSVTVDFINNSLRITSSSVGLGSVVSLLSASAKLADLAGLQVAEGKAGRNLTATVNGYDLVGEGRKLKLEGKLKGIVLEVGGTETGNRGNLVVTNGIAAILDNATEGFLESNGLIDSRIEGYNERIKNIKEQREDLVRKLETSEQRYLKKFSNLDAMLGKMRSTSNFLEEKLSALPGAAKK